MNSKSTTRGATGRRRGAVGFLVVMELSSGVLQGWFTPLLEAIGTRWHVDTAQLNWVTDMYMLMTVVFVPIIGRLGDAYGHKRMLAITAVAVTAGSVVVAIAPSYELFLLGRALQAPLAAFLPLEFAIVRERQPEKAGRSIGLLISALTFGAAVGVHHARSLRGVDDEGIQGRLSGPGVEHVPAVVLGGTTAGGGLGDRHRTPFICVCCIDRARSTGRHPEPGARGMTGPEDTCATHVRERSAGPLGCRGSGSSARAPRRRTVGPPAPEGLPS